MKTFTEFIKENEMAGYSNPINPEENEPSGEAHIVFEDIYKIWAGDIDRALKSIKSQAASACIDGFGWFEIEKDDNDIFIYGYSGWSSIEARGYFEKLKNYLYQEYELEIDYIINK